MTLKKKDIGRLINILFSSKTETKPNKEGGGKKEKQKLTVTLEDNLTNIREKKG